MAITNKFNITFFALTTLTFPMVITITNMAITNKFNTTFLAPNYINVPYGYNDHGYGDNEQI
jgi:hypothetical protein